jgi:hypothetical protein
MAFLMRLYGKEIESGVLDIYWQIVKSWDDSVWKKSVEEVVSKFKPTAQCPFPVPADFVGARGGSIEDRSTTAVNRLISYLEDNGAYTDLDIGDPALNATVERFGGLSEVSRWTYDDWKFREKSFRDAYRACVLSGDGGPKVLPGLTSLANGQIGGGNLELTDSRVRQISMG